MKNIPILSFLQRTWMLLAIVLITNYLSISKFVLWYLPTGWNEWGQIIWTGQTFADIVGAVIYLPGLFFAAWWVGLLGTHLYFRRTLDQDAHSGKYAEDWAALTPAERIRNSTWLRIGFLVGACIIAAALAK